MSTPQHRRKQLLALRRRVVAHARFDVALSGDERYELQTCRACGFVIRMSIEELYRGTPMPMIRRLVAYRATGSGVQGKCPGCTKRRRDELYPLDDR